MIPAKLTGKELEQLVVEQNEIYKKNKIASIGRYGVQATMIRNRQTGSVETQLHQSLPDFEGVRYGGKQVIFDCKVCSQASFNLSPYRPELRGNKYRQLKHMFERDEFGSECWLLFHWNLREMKTKVIDAQTWVFPVSLNMEFWQRFLASEERAITLAHCEAYGRYVYWETSGDRGTKYRPDYLLRVGALI